MFRRAAAASACALLSVAAAFTLTPPASAASTDCAGGTFCFWVDTNYSGPRYNLGSGANNPNLQANPCGGCVSSTNSAANGTWNDMASSWYNRTSVPVCIYTNASFGGSALMIKAGAVQNYTSSFNDRMSSVRPAIYHSGGGTIPPGYSCF